MLAKILSQRSNLLVLDEPTNDLDVETLELLEEMLVDFTGTVVLISHDRTFINNIVDSTIVMNDNAVIEQYIGGYDDYLEQKTKKISRKNIISSSQPDKNSKKKRKLSYHQQQELNSFPETIENLENEISIAQQHLSDPKFYQDPEVINLSMKLREMELQLEVLYDKWSKLDSEK